MLAGAGTSAFIGGCLAATLGRITGRCVEAVPTTDIVSAPKLYLAPETPTLLVSFGRSGSSPESVAAVELADSIVPDVHHLIITCNADGALAQRTGDDSFVLVLPEATHDHGFAMTSSFSAMMLSALAIFTGIDSFDARVEPIARSIEDLLPTVEPRMAALARRKFTRVVYLGSGPLQALAREAALKLLELTDGDLVTMFELTLGFRHGPKTIVNAETLIVVFMSNDPLTRAYDRDLIEELRADGIAGAVRCDVGAGRCRRHDPGPRPRERVVITICCFPYIVPAQLFAYHASLERGLTPDMPNKAGVVSRVVQGVQIHTAGE